MKQYKAKEAVMSAHYPNKYKQILLVLVLTFSSLHAIEDEWKFDLEGDKALMSCTLQEFDIASILQANIPKTDGICSVINYESGGFDFLGVLLGFLGGNNDLIGEFIGDVGSPFDLGGFAKCEMNLPDIQTSALANFCKSINDEVNITLSPISTWAVNSVDGEGLIAGGQKNDKVKTVSERLYPSGLTGTDVYETYATSEGEDIEGGFLISKIEDDPQGSTAVAFNSFDKATLVLKSLAVKTKGTDDTSVVQLPKTKGASLDLEDESVQIQTRLNADIHDFSDTLTRKLRADYINPAKIEIGSGDTMLTLAEYRAKEKNVTADFYEDKKSGLAAIYEAVENEAKAKLASAELLMTADPNYIADPSEARLRYIKGSQRNAFKYAAIIQQEKNKQMKLKIALELKHKKQLIDIAKRQAQIRSRIFRDDIARNELALLLAAVDEAIDYD